MLGLGRVNLLVGTNNCGKTSILECIELLRSVGDQHVLSAIAGRRGEWAHTGEGDSRASPGPRPDSLDLSHLFTNRELERTIRIEADLAGSNPAAGWNDEVTLSVEEPSDAERHDRDQNLASEEDNERLVLHVRWSDPVDHYKALVTDDGLLSISQLRRGIQLGRALRLGRWQKPASQAVHFVRTSGLTAQDAVRTLSKFVLTPKEEPVTQALRIVEPTVERIAPVVDDHARANRYAPGGVVVRLREVPDRIPIGSTGDGMWRMLGLALSLADAEGGVLLVDEIDTGLHYSVMEGMWRMISEQAAALSVQVFATTHSRDCYESLAAIAEVDDVTIQRIDRGREEAVRYSSEAIVAAAERSVEVR